MIAVRRPERSGWRSLRWWLNRTWAVSLTVGLSVSATVVAAGYEKTVTAFGIIDVAATVTMIISGAWILVLDWRRGRKRRQ